MAKLRQKGFQSAAVCCQSLFALMEVHPCDGGRLLPLHR